MSDLEHLMTAALEAPEARRAEALRVLRGEETPERTRTDGPMLLGMGQAAGMLGVSRPTLWRMCKAGRFEKVEILPGSFRIRRSDLEDLVAGRSSQRAEGKEDVGTT